MAIVAKEARKLVPLADVVARKVKRVRKVLPTREKRSDVIVHSHVRIAVRLPPHQAQVPTTVVVGEAKTREVEALGGRHNEVVADPGLILDIPIRRAGEEQPIVPAAPNVVVFVRRLGEGKSGRAIRVDVEDRHVGILGSAVIDPHLIPPLQEGLLATTEPYARFHRVGLTERHPCLPLSGLGQDERQQHGGRGRPGSDRARPIRYRAILPNLAHLTPAADRIPFMAGSMPWDGMR